MLAKEAREFRNEIAGGVGHKETLVNNDSVSMNSTISKTPKVVQEVAPTSFIEEMKSFQNKAI